MIAAITGAIGALQKWAGNSWLVLIALGIATAALYVDARRVRADRDAWANWARETCAHAGTTTDATMIERTVAAGRRHKVAMPRGALCRQAVQDLTKFHADTLAATTRILTTAASERDQKSTRDRAAARTESEGRAGALKTMEKADAQIEDDRVDGSWFAALNRLGGLQPPD